MISKLRIVLLFLLYYSTLFSQSIDGYWDNIRTTNETISLRAGEKKILKTADFPAGTTEVVYRITILDDNQKLSGSLVSILKAIPDPTGISQGTAGAIFLMSTIAGNDKCKYAIFTNVTSASNYTKTGKTTDACFTQNVALNKDAKLLNGNSNCLSNNPQNLWFAFESNNWLMKQKITVEVVPWIDNKASHVWDTNSKKELLKSVQKFDFVKNLSNKEQFYVAFIESISSKYKVGEFNKLLTIEKNNSIKKAIEESLKQTGELNKYYDSVREKSQVLFNKGKITEAIDVLNTEIINKNKASARDYMFLGNYYLLTKQFSKAEDDFNKGLQIDASDIMLQLKLAHVYMFTNRVSEAKDIYKKYANQNLENGKTWIDQVKTDFKEFEKFGLPPDNFKKIIRVLE